MKLKLSVFLLITILLISGGYLVWISYGQDIVDKYIITTSPTPDPYAGWKTYTNEEYGFSIKYPGDWYDRGSSSGSTYDFDREFSYAIEPPTNSIVVTDSIYLQIYSKTYDNKTITGFFNTLINLELNTTSINKLIGDSTKYNITKLNNYSIDGRLFIKIAAESTSYSGTDIPERIIYFIFDGNRLLQISVSLKFNRTDMPEIAEKMVKSIEFID